MIVFNPFGTVLAASIAKRAIPPLDPKRVSRIAFVGGMMGSPVAAAIVATAMSRPKTDGKH